MQTLSLTGITWNHTRGYLPLVAVAQRFADRDPGIEIVWHPTCAMAVTHTGC
jgi:multiple sugar transport system substrate-binding protein